MPYQKVNHVDIESGKDIAHWTAGTIIRFFNINNSIWTIFRDVYLQPFAEKYVQNTVKNTDPTKKFNRHALGVSPDFLHFEELVLANNAWASHEGVNLERRREVLVQAIYSQVMIFQRIRREAESAHVKTESENMSQKGTMKPLSNDGNTDLENDEQTIDYLQSGITDENLHIRITRQSFSPKLSYQTTVRALQRDSDNIEKIFRYLNYKKLEDCATLHLGFNIRAELLAVNYGSKKIPEWLFVKDDASLRSTIETWRLRHPGVGIVDVLVVERPGFIPYRSPSAVIAGFMDEEMADDSDGDEDDNEDIDEDESDVDESDVEEDDAEMKDEEEE